jgi:Fe-S oxidoreductase
MPTYRYGSRGCSGCGGAVIVNYPPYLESMCQKAWGAYRGTFVPASEELNEVFRKEDAEALRKKKAKWKQLPY